MTELLEWLNVAGTGIGAAIGALVALGGVIGAFGRLSQLARVRRRISTAAALAKEAHPDLQGRFETLQKEESARYLALVQGRIGYGAGGIALLTSVAALSGVFILFATFVTGSGAGTWAWEGVTGVAVMFTIVALGAGLWALDLASRRYDKFLQAYANHTATAHTKASKLSQPVLLSVAVVSSVAFVWIGGFLLGRHATETGRGLLEGDNPLFTFGIQVAMMATVIFTIVCFRFLFPELPRPGGTLASSNAAGQTSTSSVSPPLGTEDRGSS